MTLQKDKNRYSIHVKRWSDSKLLVCYWDNEMRRWEARKKFGVGIVHSYTTIMTFWYTLLRFIFPHPVTPDFTILAHKKLDTHHQVSVLINLCHKISIHGVYFECGQRNCPPPPSLSKRHFPWPPNEAHTETHPFPLPSPQQGETLEHPDLWFIKSGPVCVCVLSSPRTSCTN